MPLLAGLCFGLGYGVVQRLMELELPQLGPLGQSFDVREFPGTSLESLRLGLGPEAETQTILGDLQRLEREEQQKQLAAERRRLKEELAAKQERQLQLERQALVPPAPLLPEPTPAPLPAPAPASPPTLRPPTAVPVPDGLDPLTP